VPAAALDDREVRGGVPGAAAEGENVMAEAVTRPPMPTNDPGRGCEWTVQVDDAWRLLAGDSQKQCRMILSGQRRCPNRAAAEFDRGGHSWSKKEHDWWAYCPEHMYTRWIEGGQVLWWWMECDEEATA
jgi:hypothetical protein